MPIIKNTAYVNIPDKVSTEDLENLVPEEGVILYNYETRKQIYYNGNEWVELPQSVDAVAVFGTTYDYYSEGLVPVSTSSETFETISQYNTDLLSAGSYRIDIQFRYDVNAANRSATIRFLIDGNPAGAELTLEQSDSTNFDVRRFFGVVYFNAEQAHSLTLEAKVETSNRTLTLHSANWELIKVSNTDITT
jgi:hypothetical protein